MEATFSKALKLLRLQAPLLAIGVLAAAAVFAAQVVPDALRLIDGSGVFTPSGPRTDVSGTYDPVSKCAISGLEGHAVMGVVAVASFLASRRMFTAGVQNGASRTAMAIGAVAALIIVTAACTLLVVGATAALRQYGLENGGVMVVAMGAGYHISMTAERLMQPAMAAPEAARVIFGLVSVQAAASIAALASLGDDRHARTLGAAAIVAIAALLALSPRGIEAGAFLLCFGVSGFALALAVLEVTFVHMKSFRL